MSFNDLLHSLHKAEVIQGLDGLCNGDDCGLLPKLGDCAAGHGALKQ